MQSKVDRALLAIAEMEFVICAWHLACFNAFCKGLSTPGSIRSMLQHMLDDVAAILVNGHGSSGLQNVPPDEVFNIINGTVLQHSLHHSAPVRMRGQTHHIALDVLQSYETVSEASLFCHSALNIMPKLTVYSHSAAV